MSYITITDLAEIPSTEPEQPVVYRLNSKTLFKGVLTIPRNVTLTIDCEGGDLNVEGTINVLGTIEIRDFGDNPGSVDSPNGGYIIGEEINILKGGTISMTEGGSILSNSLQIHDGGVIKQTGGDVLSNMFDIHKGGVFNSTGIKVQDGKKISVKGKINCDGNMFVADATVSIESGGIIDGGYIVEVVAGGTLNISGTLHCTYLYIASGVCNVYPGAEVLPTSGTGIDGTLNVNSGATVHIPSGCELGCKGEINIQEGGEIVVNSGASMYIYIWWYFRLFPTVGTINVRGTLDVKRNVRINTRYRGLVSNGVIKIYEGGVFNYENSTDVVDGGEINLLNIHWLDNGCFGQGDHTGHLGTGTWVPHTHTNPITRGIFRYFNALSSCYDSTNYYTDKNTDIDIPPMGRR